MNQLVLITALVTGAVSMSGIWLGNRLTRKNEDQKWRRDRCLEAYSDFLYAVEMAISESAKAYASECGTEEHVTQCGVALNKVAEMHRTGGRIILLASDRLQSHFAALTEYIGTELLEMSLQCPKASADERNAANEKLADFMANFMAIARYDIGSRLPLDALESIKKPWGQFWQR